MGLSLGISRHGQIVFSKGYGLADVGTRVAATDRTIYPIASVSKFITAITTMKLVEKGKLRLSDRVVDHLKAFPRQEFADEITIEHLLRHQSGLVDHEDWLDSIYINERRVFTPQEFFEFIDQPLFFRPGTNYSYSNSGYAALSAILETVEQKSFNQIIIDEIGAPFGLTSLAMWPSNWNDTDATMGYELVEGEVDTSFHMMTKGMKGDGGLSASVPDLLRLMQNLTDGSVISASALDEILSPTPIGSTTIDYGLGVKFGEYAGQKTFGHSGGYKGTGWPCSPITPNPDIRLQQR